MQNECQKIFIDQFFNLSSNLKKVLFVYFTRVPSPESSKQHFYMNFFYWDFFCSILPNIQSKSKINVISVLSTSKTIEIHMHDDISSFFNVHDSTTPSPSPLLFNNWIYLHFNNQHIILNIEKSFHGKIWPSDSQPAESNVGWGGGKGLNFKKW